MCRRVHLAPLKTRAAGFRRGRRAVRERALSVGRQDLARLDCSGLVQVALQAAGITCPRDSDMQELALGSRVVALASCGAAIWCSGRAMSPSRAIAETLIHANAHHMMVAIEPVADAVARIKAAGSEVTSVKRI